MFTQNREGKRVGSFLSILKSFFASLETYFFLKNFALGFVVVFLDSKYSHAVMSFFKLPKRSVL